MHIKKFCLFFLLFISVYYYTSCKLINKPKTNIESPIIFFGGYGSNDSLWINIIQYLSVKGLIFGGIIKITRSSSKSAVLLKNINAPNNHKYDMFCVSANDFASICNFALDIKKAIHFVLDYTNSRQATLVGYNMGGMACRQYLVNHIKTSHVNILIAINSPHNRTSWANVVSEISKVLQKNGLENYMHLIQLFICIPINKKILMN